MKAKKDGKEPKTVVIDPNGTKLYTVMSEGSPLKGWEFQASDAQQVGEWMQENREWYKQNGWNLKTPCWESDPVRTAQLIWWKKFFEQGAVQETYTESQLSFRVEDLNPPRYKEWPELTADEKIELLKDRLLTRGTIYANEPLRMRIN